MKVFKFLAVTVVALIFLVGLTSIAMSGELPKVQKQVDKSSPQLVLSKPCPSGWHLKSGTPGKSRYSCVPDKPAPITCPAGYFYVDYSDAQCWVGCNEIIK
jgi:hypothetical protein